MDEGDYPYVGRGPEKFFLYEIVANKISSVDVDKVNSRKVKFYDFDTF